MRRSPRVPARGVGPTDPAASAENPRPMAPPIDHPGDADRCALTQPQLNAWTTGLVVPRLCATRKVPARRRDAVHSAAMDRTTIVGALQATVAMVLVGSSVAAASLLTDYPIVEPLVRGRARYTLGLGRADHGPAQPADPLDKQATSLHRQLRPRVSTMHRESLLPVWLVPDEQRGSHPVNNLPGNYT